MDKISILYDHYKETNLLRKETEKRRNKNFFIICILEALSFLLLIRPEKAFELMLNGINKELDTTLQLSNTILQTLLWILVVYIMIRYVQDSLYIERQYKYLSKLEHSISNFIDVFNREGDDYLEDYPVVLNFIDLFYKMLMPVVFIIINTIRIYKEFLSFIQGNTITIAFIFDSILFFISFIITWFYFFEIHVQITKFLKKHVYGLESISKNLKKILKSV